MITSAHILGQDQSLLVECQSGFLLLPPVCKAFITMQAAARQDDVDIQIVSSYRSFARQLQIWTNKWLGNTQILGIDEQPLNIEPLTNKQKIEAILTWSALPGASRHHWGTDLDVYDKTQVEQAQQGFQLVGHEYSAQGPCFELNNWLGENASEYGFYRPYALYNGGIAQEPWHLSYRPIAEDILTKLHRPLLQAALVQADLVGIDSIIANLPELFNRFVLNQGQT
jgi:LAS superfamily LD-carboxypeptidase LdcB